MTGAPRVVVVRDNAPAVARAAQWFVASLDDDETRMAVARVLDETGWEQADDLTWSRVSRPGPRTDAVVAAIKAAIAAPGPRVSPRVDVPLRVIAPGGAW